jgi:peroxiredoxin
VPTHLTCAEQHWLDGWIAGPRRTRWVSLPVQPGDAAPDLELETTRGEPLRLSTLWEKEPVVLVFLRHSGCSCTATRLDRLAEELPLLHQVGAAVACIGQAEPERANRFWTARQLQVPLLCDPERRAYEAYGLLEGSPSQIVYGAPDEFLRCDPGAGAKLQLSRHGTARAAVDSPWQLPGDMVIDRGGRLRFAHRPSYCDGAVDIQVLVAAIREGQLGSRNIPEINHWICL